MSKRPVMSRLTGYQMSPLILALVVALALPPALSVRVTATGGPQTKAHVAQPATAQPAPPDLGWPRTYALSGGSAVLYQPQIESWEQQKTMAAWSAVSYTAAGAKSPALGTVKIEAKTKVATEDRMVSFNDFQITQSNFPTRIRKKRLNGSTRGIDFSMINLQDYRLYLLDT